MKFNSNKLLEENCCGLCINWALLWDILFQAIDYTENNLKEMQSPIYSENWALAKYELKSCFESKQIWKYDILLKKYFFNHSCAI